MSVTIRPARNGRGYEYDLRIRFPSGARARERANAPVPSRSGALRWAQAREAAILAMGPDAYREAKAPAPRDDDGDLTLAAFWPVVLRDWYQAERKKASTIDAATTIYRVHLEPALGPVPLEDIGPSQIAALKGALASRSAKTANNVLSVLGRILSCAVAWGRLEAKPKIGLLRVVESERGWYEREELRRLVDAAGKIGREALVVVLLGGSAGLRRGEIRALRWSDVDLTRGQIRIGRGLWRDVEDTPKGGRGRVIPLTPELESALRAHRHLGERVLERRGAPLSNRQIRGLMAAAQRRAGLEADGGVHRLRHSFCSHLAIAGVPARAIQALAGHRDLKTSMRYMHLAPGDATRAIEALAGYVGEAATDLQGQTAGALRTV